MLLLAHTGITVGAAYLLEQAAKFRVKSRAKTADAAGSLLTSKVLNPVQTQNADCKIPWRYKLASFNDKVSSIKVDYRFILLGSMLPDLIDKPLGLFVLPAVLENLRTFSHTLLFLLLVTLAAVLVYRKQNAAWGFFIAFGVLVHFLLDSMWLEPATLLWPFLGFTFYKHPGMDLNSWLNMRLYDLTANPKVYVAEAIGFIILVFFCIKIIAEKKVRAFLLKGTL